MSSHLKFLKFASCSQQMAVVANEDGDIVMQDPLSQENSIVTEVEEEIEEEEAEVEEEEASMEELKLQTTTTRSKSASHASQRDPKLRKDVQTCFGFDEEVR